jgi:hypothetical protein
MSLEPGSNSRANLELPEFAEPVTRRPLGFLRDTEALLRHKTVSTLVPFLPPRAASTLQETSSIAEDYLRILADIDRDRISDEELKPFRIQVGLTMVGFGALSMFFLLLYFSTLHPNLSPIVRLQKYWHQYIWFACLGVTGMMLLGREAMRSSTPCSKTSDKRRSVKSRG